MEIYKKIRQILTYNFIPPEAEDNLKAYKYAAEDHSLLYNYVFSPLAAFCVEPNLITLAGLFCILLPYLVLWHFVPGNLETEVPNWLFFLTCGFHFLYFHLDNMDGKQARKTGNSSALGLIFDHGCDAISVYLQATTMMICFFLGTGLWGIFVLMTPSIMFFLTNLEELYTHKMYLPVINPAVEGVVLTGLVMLISGFGGQDIMLTNIDLPILGTFTLSQTICIGFHFVSIVSIPMIINRIYQKVGAGKTCEALRKMWFMFFTHATVIYFACYSKIANDNIRYVILLQGFNMCKQLTQMLIASSSKSVFRPFSPISFTIVSSFMINTVLASYDLPHFDEEKFLYTLVVISFIVYIHFIKNVTGQICRVLNIKCFKVKDKATQFETLYEVQQSMS